LLVVLAKGEILGQATNNGGNDCGNNKPMIIDDQLYQLEVKI